MLVHTQAKGPERQRALSDCGGGSLPASRWNSTRTVAPPSRRGCVDTRFLNARMRTRADTQVEHYRNKCDALRQEAASMGRPCTAAGVRAREAADTDGLLNEVYRTSRLRACRLAVTHSLTWPRADRWRHTTRSSRRWCGKTWPCSPRSRRTSRCCRKQTAMARAAEGRC